MRTVKVLKKYEEAGGEDGEVEEDATKKNKEFQIRKRTNIQKRRKRKEKKRNRKMVNAILISE